VLGFFALGALSTPVEARNCGIKPIPQAHWGKPAYRSVPRQGYPNIQPTRGYRTHTVASNNVLGIAKRAGDFGTLLTAVKAAGLTGLLEGRGPYTLLAPTDAAFEKLPEGALQELLADKNKLIAVLKYHVIPGRITALNILESRELKTASGESLPTSDLSVIRADVPARNGTIHVIDQVLLPAS
jgi:uncharacterized surface protein with fasciclin (FAS1) repeats